LHPARHSVSISALLFLVIVSALLSACSSSTTEPLPPLRSRLPGTRFFADTTRVVGLTPWALAVADFDTNGIADVVVANINGRSITFLYNVYGRPADVGYTASGAFRDTTIHLDSLSARYQGFSPRALAAADVNADGLPDLVISMSDTTENGLDRIIVLANRGVADTGHTYDVIADTLAGKDNRDILVGNLDTTDDGVEIVVAPSNAIIPPVVLSRLGRIASSADSTINVVGTYPAEGEAGVPLTASVRVWFDINAEDATQFSDTTRAKIVGRIETGEDLTYEVTARSITGVVAGRSVTQYLLDPKTGFRPNETVTVTLDSITSLQSKAVRPVYLAEPHTWTFTTEGLRVIGSYPVDGAPHVPTDAAPALRFNFSIDPSSITDFTFEMWREGGSKVNADVVYEEETRTVTLTPDALFAPYESIELISLPPLNDSLGRSTFVGDTLRFTTTGPLVVSTVPRNGDITRLDQLLTGNPVYLWFNTAMEPPSPDAVFVAGDMSGNHYVERIRLEGGALDKVTAEVHGGFIAGEWVTITATTGFRSATGYPLAKPYTWRYMVQAIQPAALGSAGPSFEITQAGGSVAGGILTPDGDVGLLFADTSGVFSMLMRRDGSWDTDGGNTLTYAKVRPVVETGDINNDGLLDLVVARPDSFICAVFLNTTSAGGAVSFSDPVTYEVGEGPTDIFLGDINGDGHVDIITANLLTNDVSVLLNKGDGSFESERFYMVGDHPQAVEVADLDGDGDMDIITVSSTTNRVTLLRNVTKTAPKPH
jgi:hypothetical protein